MEFVKLFESILNHMPMLLLGIGMVIGIFTLRYLKPFFLWLKGGIEDGDGILENKELTVAFFSTLAFIVVISYPISLIYSGKMIEYPDTLLICVFSGAGVLYSVNRGSQAYEKVHEKKYKDKKDLENKDHY